MHFAQRWPDSLKVNAGSAVMHKKRRGRTRWRRPLGIHGKLGVISSHAVAGRQAEMDGESLSQISNLPVAKPEIMMVWMVWGKQIAEIYWLMDHLFFPDDYGPIMENSDWVESGVESLRKWSGQNDLGRRLAELTASECKLTSWGVRSRRDDWKNPQMERDQNQKVTKEKWICRARGMTKKNKQTKCKAKGSASSVKQSIKQKKKKEEESETIWIKDGREISIVWINEQIYHRCSGDWAAWGSGRLAKVVRGSREGGGRRLRWRRGKGGGCGQWAGGDKRVLFFVMGNRKRGRERDSERLYLGGNHFGVAA